MQFIVLRKKFPFWLAGFIQWFRIYSKIYLGTRSSPFWLRRHDRVDGTIDVVRRKAEKNEVPNFSHPPEWFKFLSKAGKSLSFLKFCSIDYWSFAPSYAKPKVEKYDADRIFHNYCIPSTKYLIPSIHSSEFQYSQIICKPLRNANAKG